MSEARNVPTWGLRFSRTDGAVLTFSCVPKKVVPDGAAAIEAEMQVVGFADATEKKIDFYWRNADLTPNARPKGGVK